MMMSKVRYAKQRDQYSCGPTAIINVLKWAGVDCSYEKSLKLVQKLCGCVNPPNGTGHVDFDKALRIVADKLGCLKIRRVYYPALWQIEKQLKENGIVVLSYRWHDEEEGSYRHFMLLVEVSESGKSFLTVNNQRGPGPALVRVPRKFVRKDLLRFQKTDPHYKAWFVSLKD